MVDDAFGDFFMGDADDDLVDEEEEFVAPPVVIAPVPLAAPEVAPSEIRAPEVPSTIPSAAPAPAGPEPAVEPVAQAVSAAQPSREQRLAESLNRLMEDSQDILAAALVSLDGFTMASALPEGMQEDRVGAMSAAILGLGERAAAELGRGQLSQVFIEGDSGYVMLIAAGQRAVLTCLADKEAKLGLVLYDMRAAAGNIAEILG
jgi:predicted regulator of Ras-like GTPase activity (Roadblock/LC7/MglB family)